MKGASPNNFTRIDVDAYRQKYNPYRLKNREHYVYDAVRFAITNNRNVIFESSGASKYFPEICRLHETCKIIKVECAPETCLTRFRQRVTSNAFPFSYRPEDSIRYIAAKLAELSADLILNSEQEPAEDLRVKILSYFLQNH